MRKREYARHLSHELIDTLWNVNVEVYLQYRKLHKELIDTLWNVNMLSYKSV